jgi:hypothetical protein
VPDADGIQEHCATNGVTVVVGTASQPVTNFPLTVNATDPAELAFPLITIGPRSKTPFPPDITNVEAAGAAKAVPPVATPPAIARTATAIPEITFFIMCSLIRFGTKIIWS